MKKFTGSVHGLVYRPHYGFADYAVASFHLVDGKISNVEISDPYAAFEALAKLELLNSHHLEKLRKSYPAEFQHV